MSAPEEPTDLKAGHPPAVKAGGMRITQHKTPHANDKPVTSDAKKEDEDEETEEVSASVPVVRPQLIISGAPSRGDEDFPAASIKAYHEKPVPTNEYRVNPPKASREIHQPRKQ